MDFNYTEKVVALASRLRQFMARHIYPNELAFHGQVAAGDRWAPVELIETLKREARAQGLWNLFHAEGEHRLSNLEYSPLCEIMGRVPWSAEVFNCSAPDTGNMETLEKFGTELHKQRWLEPLLAGEIRSAFAMTEPAVASSDATNIQCEIKRRDDEYVINGRKWWISAARFSS
jgi:acyl-CoA dehydrogenase